VWRIMTIGKHDSGFFWYGEEMLTTGTASRESCSSTSPSSKTTAAISSKRSKSPSPTSSVAHPTWATRPYVTPVSFFNPLLTTVQSAKDYPLLNAGLPKLRLNLDTGHGGTYSATNGGKFGKAAVAYLEWQWRANETAKAVILDPQSKNSLVKDNWTVQSANW
jgi:hypothetical protein